RGRGKRVRWTWTRGLDRSLREGVGLPGPEHDHLRPGADPTPELLRVGLDHVPGIVVHRYHRPRLHELHRAHRVRDAHGVVVPDRDQHRVHLIRQELHLERERRVAAMVHGVTRQGDHDAAGIGREAAGLVALDLAAVVRG